MTTQLTPDAVYLVERLAAAIAPQSPWVEENSVMIFANPSNPNGRWSMGAGDGFSDCPSDKLRGKIAQLWSKREEDGKISWFLKLKCSDGCSYLIHSRHGRVFSKTMLGSLALMTEEEIRQEIIIECAPWKAEKGYLQFCNIYLKGGQKIEPPRVGSETLPIIAIAAQEHVAAACGYEYIPPSERQKEAEEAPNLAADEAKQSDGFPDDIPF